MSRIVCFALALAAASAAAPTWTCQGGHYINTDPRAGYAKNGVDKASLQNCDGETYINCKCRRCPANFVANGLTTSCSECPAEYKPNPEQTSCVPCTWRTCPAGTFNAVHTYNSHSFCGSQQCRPCPAGTYQAQSSVGATSCTPCPNGGKQTDGGKSCDTVVAESSAHTIDHTHGGTVANGKKCEHMKCFIEIGRHGQVVLRSHHHHLEFPKKDWAQVQKKHHCKVYHPSGLRPAYCECTCYDGEISEVNKNAQYSGGLVVAANAAN